MARACWSGGLVCRPCLLGVCFDRGVEVEERVERNGRLTRGSRGVEGTREVGGFTILVLYR
jgi:hypothetical protein